MANAIQERRFAIRRYLQGESASAIGRSLGRTRSWCYQWLKRDDLATPSGFQDHSRIPHRVGSNTSMAVEPLVCQIRQRLVTTTYAPHGALASQWPLPPLGVAPRPELWTINRLLKRYGLVEKPIYQPRGTP
jgi:hypothetical protein